MRAWIVAAVGSAGLLVQAATAQAATVVVVLHGLRNDAGQVMVELCNQQSYLLYSCPGRRFVPAKAGDLEVRYQGVAPGRYAVTVFHDENSDGHLNFNSIGMPLEGWGASREPKILAGPPAFADTAVDVAEPQSTIDVAMHYATAAAGPSRN
jgi:uncharacterized protein (DUF2141 family)